MTLIGRTTHGKVLRPNGTVLMPVSCSSSDVRSWLKGAPEPAALCTPDGTFERPVEDVACQLVVNSAAEVCVPDTQADLRLRDLPQIKEFRARAWLGTPITDADGYVLGNLCAMDTVVHHWTDVPWR